MCHIHDNADAHKCNLVQDLLEAETVVQLPNPLYSPDLSLCDIFLITLLKNNLSRCRYEPQSAFGSVILLPSPSCKFNHIGVTGYIAAIC